MRIVTVTVSMMFCFAVLYGCGGGGSTSSSWVSSAQKAPAKVLISGSVVDASINTIVKATVTKITDQAGKDLAAAVTTDAYGLFTITLTSMPQSNVVLTVTATDYITSYYTVAINTASTAPNTVYNVKIPLVSLTKSAQGADYLSGTVTQVMTSPGTTDSDFSKEIVMSNGVRLKATIAKGSVLKNAQQNLLGSTLTLIGTVYNPQSNNALALAPQDSGLFLSAGFTDVTVRDSKGVVATSITNADPTVKPLTIKMDLDNNTLDPNTWEPVKTGAQLLLYTYDKITGTWTPDTRYNNGSVTVQEEVVNGRVVKFVEFGANHFSYWNIGPTSTNICEASLSFSNEGDDKTLNAGLGFSVSTNDTGNKIKLKGGTKPPKDTSAIILQNFPKALENKIIIDVTYNGESLGSTITDGHCGTNTITLPPIGLSVFTWTVQMACPTGYIEGPHPMVNVAVYSCPPGTPLSPFNPSTPGCTVVAATEANGKADIFALSNNVLFFKPSDIDAQPVAGGYYADDSNNTINYVRKWDFCQITGTGTGTGTGSGTGGGGAYYITAY